MTLKPTTSPPRTTALILLSRYLPGSLIQFDPYDIETQLIFNLMREVELSLYVVGIELD